MGASFGGLLLFSGLSGFGHVCMCICMCMCLYMMCVGFILLYSGCDCMPLCDYGVMSERNIRVEGGRPSCQKWRWLECTVLA